jgi:MurNAc alpha-1-phosphate uridylyltransferase
MKAMILAAGRGKRMGDLTLSTPKPLIKISDRYLIEYSIEALKKINIKDIVINISYHSEQIKKALGDGKKFGVNIEYSEEPELLETGGGILQALPLLGNEPFIVLSSDVVTDYPLQKLLNHPEKLAHIVLVDNPQYHPRGDFGLLENKISLQGDSNLTFGNIGIYKPELFNDYKPGHFRLGDVLKKAIANEQVTGEHYQGNWHNVGTPEDLKVVGRSNE